MQMLVRFEMNFMTSFPADSHFAQKRNAILQNIHVGYKWCDIIESKYIIDGDDLFVCLSYALRERHVMVL